MKVRISIPGLYTAMELDEEKAFRAFRKLNEVLLSQIKALEDKTAEAKTEAPEIVEPERNWESILEEKERDIETKDPIRTTYKGFIYARCPECGTVRGFCMKKVADHYHCDSCGTRTVFEKPLVPLRVNCECGARFKYLTNLTESAFDIPCLECGAPVAVEWNEKKQLYETIG